MDCHFYLFIFCFFNIAAPTSCIFEQTRAVATAEILMPREVKHKLKMFPFNNEEYSWL
jgi:hypothetical protein